MKLNDLNYKMYIVSVRKYYHKHRPHIRLGQSYADVLEMLFPKIYDIIKKEGLDPFYNDGFIKPMLKFIKK